MLPQNTLQTRNQRTGETREGIAYEEKLSNATRAERTVSNTIHGCNASINAETTQGTRSLLCHDMNAKNRASHELETPPMRVTCWKDIGDPEQ